MSDRLISADKVAEAIAWLNEYDYIIWHDVMERIDKLPTVDAVEVVRCKDCVHYCKRYVLGDSIEDDEYYMACDMGLGELDDDWSVNDRVLPDDFCSRGERREDERK